MPQQVPALTAPPHAARLRMQDLAAMKVLSDAAVLQERHNQAKVLIEVGGGGPGQAAGRWAGSRPVYGVTAHLLQAGGCLHAPL